MANVSRGTTRIWIILLALIELTAVSVAVRVVWSWAHENPFDQFDEGYEPVWLRLAPFAVAIIAVPVAGWVFWLVARWVARGFSN
jgi:hypothetical protein